MHAWPVSTPGTTEHQLCPRFPRRMHAHLVYIVVVVG